MNFPSDSLICSNKSTTKLINKLHSMPWLKQRNSSDMHREKIPREKECNAGERSFRTKKTDEVYFCGTREAKKEKRNKKKKEKIILAIDNLDNFVRASRDEIPLSQSDSKKASEHAENYFSQEKNGGFKTPSDLPAAVDPTSGNTVWSVNTRVADVLFPNVQSVRIDRMEEAEMLSRALAESIATVQLEKFKKNSPVKENSWDALYGDKDDDDDGGWDNVRINLPVETERTIPGRIACNTGRRSNYVGNNNSSKSGILRNKNESTRHSILSCENLDFGFKKSSENRDEKVERVRSLKSVAFDESVNIEIVCDEPNDEDCDRDPKLTSDKATDVSKGGGDNREPVIDKFGRVNGYSERRLFMGKGARMREQLYIQSTCGNENRENDVQTIPTIMKKQTIQDNVGGAARSLPKSYTEKHFQKKDSPHRDFEISSSMETIISCSATKESGKSVSHSTAREAIGSEIDGSKQMENEIISLEIDSNGSDLWSKKEEAIGCEQNSQKTMESTTIFHETNNEPQDENYADTTTPFYMLNTDTKNEKQGLASDNSDSICDALESQFLQSEANNETDGSTIDYGKQEISEFLTENPHRVNDLSMITGMLFTPPTYPPELSHRDDHFTASNIATENLNLAHCKDLNNLTKWQTYQSIPAHQLPPDYNHNPCFIADYPIARSHHHIPHNDNPYLVNHAAPQYWRNPNVVPPLPTIDYAKLSSTQSIAEKKTSRFVAAHEPGFVKVSQLPPGFAKTQFAKDRNCCEDNYARFVSAGFNQRVSNSVSKIENKPNESSAREIEDYFGHTFAERMPEHFKSGIPPSFHKQFFEYRQTSDPSLGTAQRNHSEVDIDWKLISEMNIKPLDHYANDRFLPTHNAGVHIVGQTPNDDYFVSSSQSQMLGGLHPFGVLNASLQNAERITPHSAFPHCQIPHKYPTESCGDMHELQFGMNAMNPMRSQPRPIPGYSPLITNRFQRSETAARNGLAEINQRPIGQSFSDVKVGRGRSRLIARDLMRASPSVNRF